LVVRIDNELYQIVSYQHVKMQQRAPIVKTRMMKLKSGSVIEQSFRSGDKFEDVFLERKEIQYLYSDGDLMHGRVLQSAAHVARLLASCIATAASSDESALSAPGSDSTPRKIQPRKVMCRRPPQATRSEGRPRPARTA